MELSNVWCKIGIVGGTYFDIGRTTYFNSGSAHPCALPSTSVDPLKVLNDFGRKRAGMRALPG